MEKESNKIYTEEQITIIKPLKSNKIFNEEKFEIISFYDKEGNRIVLLKEKIIKVAI